MESGRHESVQAGPPKLTSEPKLYASVLLIATALGVEDVSAEHGGCVASSLQVEAYQGVSFLAKVVVLQASQVGHIVLLPLLMQLLPFAG